jgi:signal transduction histidine kinase
MDPDAAVGKYVLDAMPQLAGTEGLRATRRTLDDRVATEWEESYGPDVRLRGRAYPTADGGVLVVATNVTEEWRARLAAREALDRARLLQDVTLEFGGALRPAEVAEIALTRGLASLRASAGVVYVLDAANAVLHAMAWQGISRVALAPWMHVPLDSSMMISEAVRAGTPIYVGHRAEVVERYPQARESNRLVVPDAWASIPLINDGRTLGGISIGFADMPEFTDADRNFIETFAGQCAQAFDRARLYQEAAEAREAAERANRAKSDFLAAMSHELRTPLNAIGGYTDLLAMGLRGPLTSTQEEDLRRIARNQTHLLGIINDILNFARLDAGTVDIDIEDTPVHEVVADIEPLIAPQLGQRQLDFVISPCDRTLSMRADREKVQQVLLNLLTNAVKFTEPGGEIGLRVTSDATTVNIAVHDTGAGIAPDKLGAIFEPFVQLHRSHAHPTTGTGLGLAISRDLARKMGGDITVSSTPGTGSAFTLALPRVRPLT